MLQTILNNMEHITIKHKKLNTPDQIIFNVVLLNLPI